MTVTVHNWPAIKADYVEGIEVDGALTWPSVNELAARHGISNTSVRTRSVREEWTAERAAFQRRLEHERQSARAGEVARLGADLDVQALRIARNGLAITATRMAELGAAAAARTRAQRAEADGEDAPAPTTQPAQGLPVNAQELERLSRTASEFYALGTRAIGDVQRVRVDVDERDSTDELTAAERDDRSLGLIAILADLGKIDPEVTDVIDVAPARLRIAAAANAYADRDPADAPSNAFIPRTLTTSNKNLKQTAFLLLDHREVFYGGAAGGAKTAGILAAALQYVDEPNYDALLLRENYKQLSQPGAWIPMSHEWLDGTGARYHSGAKQWTFPSGATLTFGFVNPHMGDDVRKFQTGAYHFIGIDELTGWREDDYRFLFSRLRRRAGSSVPPRMRSASNPGGRGHEWVKRRFVDITTARETALFVSSRLSDNPYIDQSDYVESLREQHPTNWRRLLFGDWSVADPGSLFQPRVWLDDDDFLEAMPPRRDVVRAVRYWDLAAAAATSHNPDPDWTAGARISKLRSGTYCLEHVVRVRLTPAQTEATVRSAAEMDRTRVNVQWVEQVPGAGAALVDHFKRNVFPEDVLMRGDTGWSGRTKAMRARPLAALMEKHKLRIVRAHWNEALFDELEAFSEDPQHSGAHDDQVDACSGALAKVMRTTGNAVIGAVPRGTVER